MYKEKLKRCGICLLIISGFSFSFNHWIGSDSNMPINYGYLFFTLPSLLAGLCLFYKMIKAVNFTVLFTSMYLSSLPCSLIVSLIRFPFGYWIANMRFNWTSFLLDGLMTVLIIASFYWICRELTGRAISAVQKEHNIAPPKVYLFLIAGISFAAFPLIATNAPSRTKLEQNAILMAKEQMGDRYNYVVTNIRQDINHDTHLIDKNSRLALVAAYNDSDFKTLQIHLVAPEAIITSPSVGGQSQPTSDGRK